MKLYEISKAMQDALAIMDSQDFDPETIANTMAGMQCEFDEKAARVVAVVKNYRAEAEALKAEAKKLTERAKSAQNNSDRLLAYLELEMRKIGAKQSGDAINGAKFGRLSERTVVNDIGKAPAETEGLLFTVERKPNTTAIKAWIKDGNACDWASIETNQNLLIK